VETVTDRSATPAIDRAKAPKPTIDARQRAEERELLRRYAKTGDRRLREELIERFMPLARSLAMRYRGGREPLDDLVQVANLGLVKAVDGFDPERGKPFTAYAVPTILGELRRHFRDRVWNLRLPRGLQELTMEVDEVADRLTEELGRAPTIKHIAAELGAEDDVVLEALQAADARRTSSLDQTAFRDQEGSRPVIETIGASETGYDRVEAELASGSADLDAREKKVLEMRFRKGMTQYEIGAELGVSQMQISRISRKALRKLLEAVQGDEEG
jgi:RNA polymerase sigma-B factor